ncbi:MAG: YraN family protein [Gemmatimonadetes bacterium]|nr:YraN family protein [Gemmatimonadota bacterium]
MRAHELGRRGEEVAARYLEARGWTILERNARFGHKEIDLIARREGVIAFVEVKTRAGTQFGHPLEAITQRKRREIRTVAAAWLRRARPGAATLRFDAVSVVFRGAEPALLEHVEDAWRITDRF